MDNMPFAEVDFYTPVMYLGIAGIFLVFTIPLLIHGLFRRRRFSKLSDGYQTHKERASIRAELITGAANFALTLAFGISFLVGYHTAITNLFANIEQRYQPTALTVGTWNGSWATVDLTLPDGTRFTDSVVEVRDGSEPFIEDIWYHENPELKKFR